MFVRFSHHDAHYYIIISHNTLVPMIGHLELASGSLRHMPHGRGLKNLSVKSDFSQMHLSRSGFDYKCRAFCLDYCDRSDC